MPRRGGKERVGRTSRGDIPTKTVSDPPHLGAFAPPPYFSDQVTTPLRDGSALFKNPGEGLQQNLAHKLVSLSRKDDESF